MNQPTEVGGHTLLRELGRGSMSVVYEARDPKGERVALKAILEATERRRRRFLLEAEVMQFVGRHPNVVTLRAFGDDQGCLFLTMDLLDGEDFDAYLSGPRSNPADAAAHLVRVARGVHFAHEAGVLHRNLKPANLFLAGDRLLVMDFGLAKDLQREEQLTIEGSLVGTVAYMSPEQVRGEGARLDRTADVYALGVILYEALAGERPFSGDMLEVVRAIVNEPPPPIAGASPGLEAVCFKALAKEPADRYQTAEDFARDLETELGTVAKGSRQAPWSRAPSPTSR